MKVSSAMAGEGTVRRAPVLLSSDIANLRSSRMPDPVPRRFGLAKQGKSGLVSHRVPRLVVTLCKIFFSLLVVDALVARWFFPSTGGVSSGETYDRLQERAPGPQVHRVAIDESGPRALSSVKSETASSRDERDTNTEKESDNSQDTSVADSADSDSDSGKETKAESGSQPEPWEVLPRRSDWEESGPPAWCAKLAEDPRPWSATPGTPEDKKRCGRRTNEGECYDGSPITFFSQHHQDAYVYLKHFKNLRRRGSYLDIAANEPVQISNTFYMDRCLGWKGVCVEANPTYFERLTKLRSCNLVKTCVSDSNDEVTFRLSGAVGGLETTVKTARKPSDRTIKLRCKTLNQLAEEHKLTMVDYLSLDVEGNELHVLKGWDPKSLVIKVINIETNNKQVRELLASAGYRRLPIQPVEAGGKPGAEYDLRFHMDAIYLHPSVTWGRPE